MARQGLYGHTSQETAYMIDDYPYGRTERCRRRVWLEYKEGHGYRFVAQTEHPRKLTWNKPHTSTYVDVAACLYLDEQGHVAWAGVGQYTSETDALAFAEDFGHKCEGWRALHVWARKKAALSKALGTGQAHFTINKEVQERSEFQKGEDLKEASVWARVAELMVGPDAPTAPANDA